MLHRAACSDDCWWIHVLEIAVFTAVEFSSKLVVASARRTYAKLIGFETHLRFATHIFVVPSYANCHAGTFETLKAITLALSTQANQTLRHREQSFLLLDRGY
jgi:hypothetical protein